MRVFPNNPLVGTCSKIRWDSGQGCYYHESPDPIETVSNVTFCILFIINDV